MDYGHGPPTEVACKKAEGTEIMTLPTEGWLCSSTSSSCFTSVPACPSTAHTWHTHRREDGNWI